MNNIPIRIELISAPGIAIQADTDSEHNDPVSDPIVDALAQLVRDAYAAEQRMRARFRVLGSPDAAAESMTARDEPSLDESAHEPKPERRKSA